MAVSGGSSSVPSLPSPRPKSPPGYPDLYGKRRGMAKVQMLEREIGFLEDELKSLEGLQPASKSCKEVTDFVVANSDPFIPTSKKPRRSYRFWKWLCEMSCMSFSWKCCRCVCSLPRCPKMPRLCCNYCSACVCCCSWFSCSIPNCCRICSKCLGKCCENCCCCVLRCGSDCFCSKCCGSNCCCSCPECPECPKCPKCPKCLECPKCPTCPECPKCPTCPNLKPCSCCSSCSCSCGFCSACCSCIKECCCYLCF